MKKLNHIAITIVLLGMLFQACSNGAIPTPEGETGRLKVIATTTIVADVVHQVGGDLIELHTLLPYGVDPHAFDPRPQDIAAVSDADIVFANGAGLEEFLLPLLESAGAQDRLYEVSERIALLDIEAEDHADELGSEHDHEGFDPHTWTDPNNVIIWVENITKTLSIGDPENAAAYAANAEAYIIDLHTLDEWIREQVESIPLAHRKLVTDHRSLGYFADEYSFEQVGALIGSFSSNASPSAQELAALEDAIRTQDVPAVFVGFSVSADLAEQVAQDTGVRVVRVYTGSLTEAGGVADSYLNFMRYNVSAIVEALK